MRWRAVGHLHGGAGHQSHASQSHGSPRLTKLPTVARAAASCEGVGSPERESSNGSPTPQYEGVLNMPDDLILNFRAQSSSLLYGMVAVA